MKRNPSRRFELLFPIVLLVLLVGLNLLGMWVQNRMREAFAEERERRCRAESQLFTLRLQTQLHKYGEAYLSEIVLLEHVQRQQLGVVVGLYGPDGARRFRAASSDAGEWAGTVPETSQPGILETENRPGTAIRITQPLFHADGRPFGHLFFLFIPERGAVPELARALYDLPFWLVVVLMAYWIGTRLLTRLRPAPDDSTAGGEIGDLRVVTAGYQHIIDRLQLKGKELERLHEAERVRAESSERFSDRLVAGIPNALVVVAADGRISLTNVQARRLFGTTDSSPTQTEFFAETPEIAELTNRVLRTGEADRRTDIRADLGGARRVLEAQAAPIPGRSGDVQGVLCLVNDQTEVEELRTGMRLKETLANLGEMAAGIAHEFKNSLATISGYAQLFEREAASELKRPAQAMRAEVTHLTQVVTDFLNFARPQDPVFVPVDLRELIEDCFERLGGEADRKAVRLTLSGTFPTVSGDAVLLGRALLNLIRNAVEAVPEEAEVREVSVTGALVERASDDAPAFCRISVADTGTGIPESELSKVFIPFFTTKSRGYGIGLAIVQKVFVGHNGRVEVESRPGIGTTFNCFLPISEQ